MEVVDGMHTVQRQVGWSYVGRCWTIFRVRGDTLMTPDHSDIQVQSSGKNRAGIDRSSWKGRHFYCHVINGATTI